MKPVSARLFATIQLVRPFNVLLSMTGVAVGAVLASGWETFSGTPALSIVIAMISAGAISAAANAVNDIFDVEIDYDDRSGDVHDDRRVPRGRVPG